MELAYRFVPLFYVAPNHWNVQTSTQPPEDHDQSRPRAVYIGPACGPIIVEPAARLFLSGSPQRHADWPLPRPSNGDPVPRSYSRLGATPNFQAIRHRSPL